VLVDERVFDQDRRPERLLHRDAELSALHRAVGERGEHVLVHGPSGAGKTALVQAARERLARDRGCETAYVESMDASTAGIVRRVLAQVDGPTPPANTPQEDLCVQLYDRIDEPAVVVLDEADSVHETAALQRLLDVESIAVVVVVHDPDRFLTAADERVRTVVRTPALQVEKFATDELADILAARARRGLRPDAWDRDVLRAIAERAEGIARPAIQTLRSGAAEASDRGDERLTTDVLDAAEGRAQRRILRYNLETLPFHHRLLYELVRQAGSVPARELYERYDRVADEAYRDVPSTPISRRARRRKLAKLVDYGLLERVGDGRTVYQVVDPEVGPPVGIRVPEQPDI